MRLPRRSLRSLLAMTEGRDCHGCPLGKLAMTAKWVIASNDKGGH